MSSFSSSGPSPKFDELYRCFLKEIGDVKGKFQKIRDNDLKFNALTAIDQIESTYRLQINDMMQSNPRLREVTKDCIHRVDELSKEIFPAYRDSIQELNFFGEILGRLKSDFHNFQYVVSRRLIIDKFGFENYLQDDWGKQEFASLILVKNKWANDQLEELLANDKDLGFEVLMQIGTELSDLLKRYQEHPSFQAVIKREIAKQSNNYLYAHKTIRQIVIKSNSYWVQRLLIESANKGDLEAIETLELAILESENNLEWMHPLLLDNFKMHQSWALGLLLLCIDQRTEYKTPTVIQELLSLAKRDSELKHILTAYAILLGEEHLFMHLFLQCFSNLKSRLNRGTHYVLQLKQIEKDHAKTNRFLWDGASVPYKINVLRLLMRREEKLVQVLTDQIDDVQFEDSPVTKCFPSAKTLLCGNWDIALSLKPLLQNNEIEIMVPIHVSEHVRSTHGIQRTITHQYLEQWLQDYSSYHQNGVRLPHLAFVSDESRSLIIVNEREKRLKSRLGDKYNAKIFPSMNILRKDPFQLCFLDYLSAKYPTLDEVSIQFTHNEGGNCLTGEEEGLPYAIIGKDAVELNMRLLKQELSTMGLKKMESGQWALDAPYPTSDCKLSEDDLRRLFALDMGLASAKQVYFVEQPEFHLDMSMAILDGKKVILNDSMMAYELFQDFASKETPADSALATQDSIFAQRSAQLLLESQRMKQYEDAAAQDLKEQGFEVIRIGGIFTNILERSPDNHQVNLFNFISFKDSKDQQTIVAMGGPQFFQDYFIETIETHLGKVAIHFLDQTISEDLLMHFGGLHCVSKLSPREF